MNIKNIDDKYVEIYGLSYGDALTICNKFESIKAITNLEEARLKFFESEKLFQKFINEFEGSRYLPYMYSLYESLAQKLDVEQKIQLTLNKEEVLQK